MTAGSTPLRIAVDARSLLCREPRGEGKSLLRLYTEILALRPDTRVLMVGDERAARFTGTLPPSVRCVWHAAIGDRWNSWEAAVLPWLAWRHRCHVLHAASSSAPRWSPVPVLMTVHDLIPMLFDDGQDAAFKARFRARLRAGLASARRVIAVSHHTRSDLLASFPALRVPVDVVHWGADDLPAPAGPALPGTPPTIVAFGGESARKNTDAMLARFMAAAPRVPAMRLVLLGISAAWQQRRVQEQLAAAGLAGRVDVPGFVSEAALQTLVQGARAVLYLSLYEGFGLPVVDSIALGVPVVASDRTSLPEILDGVPGALPLDATTLIEDTLVTLATDDAVRADWVHRQRSVLARFRWHDVARNTLRSLDAVAGRPPHNDPACTPP